MQVAPFAALFLGILFFQGLSLPGSGNGLGYYLQPNFAQLLDVGIWADAVSQSLFSLALCTGTMIAHGSAAPKEGPLVRASLAAAALNSACAIIVGLVVFTASGHLARQESLEIEEALKHGPGVVFAVFPAALALLPLPQLFSVLFFVAIIAVGAASACVLMQSAVAVVRNCCPRLRQHPSLASGLLCFVGFLLGLPMCTEGGWVYVEVVDYYLSHHHLVMIGIVEVVCIGWCYGTERLASEVWLATGEAAPRGWRAMVRVGCPMALISLLLSTIIQDFWSSGIKYSSGMTLLGWLVFVAGSSWIVIGAVWPVGWRTSSTPIDELAGLADEGSSETLTGASERNAAVRTVSASLVELVVERAGSGIASLRHSLSGHQLLRESSPENSPATTPRTSASTALPRPASTPPETDYLQNSTYIKYHFTGFFLNGNSLFAFDPHNKGGGYIF
eukprot:gene5388-6535_t